MENLSHSLAGLLVAEIALRSREVEDDAPPAPVARAAYWLSIAANNFPDIDLAWAHLTPGRLGYLLHHRGLSHTVLGALPQIVFLWGLTVLLLRLRSTRLSTRDSRWLLLLAAVGLMLHLGLDALNSYGVHPFWPWDNRWYYGDTLFIVEPMLWLAILPVLWWTSSGRARTVVSLLMLVAVALLWKVSLVPWYAALPATLWGAALFVGFRFLSPLRRALSGAIAAVFLLLAFNVVSKATKQSFRAHWPRELPLVDVVLTPYPANLFCWDAIGVASDGNRYRLARATLAAFPSIIAAARCPSLHESSSLPLQPVHALSDPAIHWSGEATLSIDRWLELERNPVVAALLRFARAPFYVEGNGLPLVGDLRYDHGEGRGFATIVVSPEAVAPPHVPPWTPPRRDLLLSPLPSP